MSVTTAATPLSAADHERAMRDYGRRAEARARALGNRGPIRLGAQAHLERFYAELGFVRASEPYDEDGIPHVEMLRAG